MTFWFDSHVLRPLLSQYLRRVMRHIPFNMYRVEHLISNTRMFHIDRYGARVECVSKSKCSICSELPINALLAANCSNTSRTFVAMCISVRICVRRVTYVFHDNFGLAILTRRDLRTYFRKFDPLPAGEMSSVGELKIRRMTRCDLIGIADILGKIRFRLHFHFAWRFRWDTIPLFNVYS